VQHSEFALTSVVVSLALFLAMVLFIELGRRIGLKEEQKHGKGARAGVGVVDGTVYGLLGLLLGFAFNGAAGRFDKRRELVLSEAHTFSVAWQRIDALPAHAQPAVRDGLRRYLDAVLTAYQHAPGSTEARNALAVSQRAWEDVWGKAMAACLLPDGEKARMLLLPALNEAYVAVDEERLAHRLHAPLLIFVMIGITALAASVFAGYALASTTRRNWMYVVGVAATISIATYVILELDSPRLGLIRIDRMNEVLVEVRSTMN
jgi:hypothetical protein